MRKDHTFAMALTAVPAGPLLSTPCSPDMAVLTSGTPALPELLTLFTLALLFGMPSFFSSTYSFWC